MKMHITLLLLHSILLTQLAHAGSLSSSSWGVKKRTITADQRVLQAAGAEVMKAPTVFLNEPKIVVTESSVKLTGDSKWILQTAQYWQLQNYVLSGLHLPDAPRFNMMYNETLFNSFSISDRRLYGNVRESFTTITKHARAFYEETMTSFTLFAARTEVHALQLKNAFNGVSKAIGTGASDLTDKQKLTLGYYFKIAGKESAVALKECSDMSKQLQDYDKVTQADKKMISELKKQMAAEKPELDRTALKLANQTMELKKELVKYRAEEASLQKQIDLWHIAIWWGPIGAIAMKIVTDHLKRQLENVRKAIETDNAILRQYEFEQRNFIVMRRDFENMMFDATDFSNSVAGAEKIVTSTANSFKALGVGIETLQGSLENANGVGMEEFFLSQTFKSQMKSAADAWAKVEEVAGGFSRGSGTRDENGKAIGGNQLVMLDGDDPKAQALLKAQGVTMFPTM